MTGTVNVSNATGDAAVVLDAGAALARPYLLAGDEDDVRALAFVVPDGYEVRTVNAEQHQPFPYRKRGSSVVRTVEGFVDLVNKHGEPDTELFANPTSGTVVAVLNAHSADVPGWGDHRVTLTLTPTPAWQRWQAVSGRLLPQVEFAEHVEASLPDFVAPSASVMLELAQSFEATKGVSFKSSERLSSGERALRYEETVAARAGQRGELTIPTTMDLALSPWRGVDPYKVTARFRYRIANGDLYLGVVLDRVEDVIDAAFRDVLDKVRDGLESSLAYLLVDGDPQR